MADIYLKKQNLEDDLLFDLMVENNSISGDNTYLTASLLSIFTDASVPQIGTQIDGKTIGNPNYNVDKLSIENIKAYEQGILKATQWLIDDKIVTSISVLTEKVGNRLNVQVTFVTKNEGTDNLKFSLDEKMEILD